MLQSVDCIQYLPYPICNGYTPSSFKTVQVSASLAQLRQVCSRLLTLGEQVWAKRTTAYELRVREKEGSLNLALPIKPRIFEPEDGDMGWYILACELAYDL